MAEAANIFKDYVTPAVAIYGVVQVWLIGLWRRFFRQATVEIHPTSAIEVGFSSFGPTIGIYGTLLAIHRPVFVENISVTIQRRRDQAQHQFDWLAFRSNQLTVGAVQGLTLELASGFIVTPTQPHRYNILLSDRQQRQDMIAPMTQISQIWTDLDRTARVQDPIVNVAQLFQTLVRGGQTTQHWTALQRLCYWEAGEYSLEVRVRTLRPNRTFFLRRSFSFTDQDAERLRFNAFVILAELCAQPNTVYNFAYPALQ